MNQLSRRDFLKGMAGASAAGILASAAMPAKETKAAVDETRRMKPGKYTEAAMAGHWGIWKLPVTVTVNETSLLKIEVPEDRFAHGETEVILNSVKEKFFDRIIENQSLAVDAITGATLSSNCVRMGADAALKSAFIAGGLDEAAAQEAVDDLFWGDVEKPEPEGPIDVDVDLLVIGMGTGGIVAATRAAEYIQSQNTEYNNGNLVSVLAIDKAGKVGGRSALTHEFNAVNPPKFKEIANGGEDFVDVDKYYNDWLEYGKTKDGTLSLKQDVLDMFFAESGNAIDWLYDHGWRFGSMSKSEATGEYVKFNSVLCSNVDPGTYEDRRGKVDDYYKAILARYKAAGGKLLLETEATDYIFEDGAVKGAYAVNRVTGQEYVIHAKAVIAGCGGYGDSEELCNEIPRDIYKGRRKSITLGEADGKMLKAALNLGAAGYNLDMSPMVMHLSLDHWLTKYPIEFKEGSLNGRTGRQNTWTLNDIPLGLGINADTIALNKEGKRFDGEAFLLRFADDVYKESWCAYQSGNYYYSIYSKNQLDEIQEKGFVSIPRWEGYCAQGGVPKEMPLPELYECLDQAIEEGMAWKGDTLEELCAQLPDPIDPAVLAETIDRYNSLVEAGEDTDFGKDPQYLLSKVDPAGPFYIIQIWNAIFSTCGGLDVDPMIRVLNEAGEPIPGLYAIGCDSLGVLMNGERNYTGFGGVAQGWYLTSGYVAAISACDYIKETYGGFTYISPALDQTEAQSA